MASYLNAHKIKTCTYADIVEFGNAHDFENLRKYVASILPL